MTTLCLSDMQIIQQNKIEIIFILKCSFDTYVVCFSCKYFPWIVFYKEPSSSM